MKSRVASRSTVVLVAMILLAGACGSDPDVAAPSGTGSTGGATDVGEDSAGTGTGATTSSSASTTLPLIELPPLVPEGPRDETGTGGDRASYVASWVIRPTDGEPYNYVVVKDGTTRTAYRFADVLYVDDQGLDYVCTGMGGAEPRCAVASDRGSNTLVVDGARVRVQELGPFALTNLSFMPEEVDSDVPGLDRGPRAVGRWPTTCITINGEHSLARFAGAQYCETTTNVIARLDRTGDGTPEVELALYEPEVNPTLVEPAVRPVDDPALFAELVSDIGV